MILSSISLNNIRIHKSFNTDFAERLNYIVGGNGLGKTTILEAIYYLCTTKSFSSYTDYDVTSFGKDDFMIEGSFVDRTKNKAAISYSKTDNKKNYYINDKRITRFSSAIGKFPVVLLTPSDHSITQGAPADRRRFVDSVISQANKNYLETLIEYNRTLRQRSALLIKAKENKIKEYQEELKVWTTTLIEKGSELIKYRSDFIKNFADYIKQSYSKIMGEEETPGINYFFLEGRTSDDIEKTFSGLLNERKNEEIWRGANLVGPHRDEYIFEINEKNLKTFGSQGQHKTFQTSLRFAEFFYLKDITGTAPIFLLDDVFGELDARRANKISEYLSEVGQAVITLTDFGDFSFLKIGDEDNIIRLEKSAAQYV